MSSGEERPVSNLPTFGSGQSWLVDSTTWDTIYVQGAPWHGRFKITGAKRHYKWDVKDAAGVEGWYDTYRGKRPKPFKIQFFIWTDAQWDAWVLFSKAFQYNGIVGLVTPVDISHPSLAAVGIYKVKCVSLGVIEVAIDNEKWGTVDVELEEYSGPPPPINATTSPKSAAGTPKNLPGNPAVSAEAALLQAQIYTMQALNKLGGTPGGMP